MWEAAENYKSIERTCNTRITGDGKLYVNGQLHVDKLHTPPVQELLQLSHCEREDLCASSPKQHIGRTTVDGGTSFCATAARMSPFTEVRKAYQVFLLQPGRLAALHNMSIYRITTPSTTKTEESWADDGEHGAGKQIRTYLQNRNLSNVAVFISLASDGTLRGPRRIKLMEDAVDSALSKLLASE